MADPDLKHSKGGGGGTTPTLLQKQYKLKTPYLYESRKFRIRQGEGP